MAKVALPGSAPYISWIGCGSFEIAMPNGAGFTLHFASTAASPACCHDCWLSPRGNADDGEGPCADNAAAAAHPKATARAVLDVIGAL